MLHKTVYIPLYNVIASKSIRIKRRKILFSNFVFTRNSHTSDYYIWDRRERRKKQSGDDKCNVPKKKKTNVTTLYTMYILSLPIPIKTVASLAFVSFHSVDLPALRFIKVHKDIVQTRIVASAILYSRIFTEMNIWNRHKHTTIHILLSI